MLTIVETRVTIHIDDLGPEPQKALSRLDRAKGKDWEIIRVDALAVGATVTVSVPAKCVGLETENRIKTRIAEIVDDADVKAGYTRLARKIGILGIALAIFGVTGCGSVKPIRVQASYKNVTLAMDLEISR